ncbi:hypothetical protein [[Mycoplasma] testudinis]|nr:hypothetical protein [[Mycoplasma] testudinis]
MEKVFYAIMEIKIGVEQAIEHGALTLLKIKQRIHDSKNITPFLKIAPS